MFNKTSPMTEFEQRTSGVGSDRFANWATTTARGGECYAFFIKSSTST